MGHLEQQLPTEERCSCFLIDHLPPSPRLSSLLRSTFPRHFTLCTWDEKGGNVQPSVEMFRVKLYTLTVERREQGWGGAGFDVPRQPLVRADSLAS